MSSDPLPTVQIDGVVWTQLIVGNTVYVGGSFTTARPAGADPGTQTVARSNFLAYDLTTGALLTTFAPSFDGQVRALAVSPDQKTLYVGGQFTSVDGVSRYRLVAFDLTTNKVATKFVGTMNASVFGLATVGTTVYVGGNFTSANGQTRSGAAALDATTGAVQPFAVTPAGGNVRQIIVSPDQTKVVIGGSFTSMNGSSDPGYGMAMVDATSGALLPLPLNSLLRNAGAKSSVTSLVATPAGFYGSGYSQSRAQGTMEGSFRADWYGNLVWYEDCHGDTYSVALSGEEVYIAGHPHYCGGVGAFPQTPVWTHHRALAFSQAVTGVLGTDPWNYHNYAGTPAPTQLNWYPDINFGTYTGQSQGPWSVAANAQYVVYGGEFTAVNGTAQQGLVRFVRTSQAPNADGPRLGGAATGLTVRAYGSSLRISWPANWDRDNERLSYRLFRDGSLVYETAADSTFYRRPILSYLDTAVVPGQAYSYKLKAVDPFGNAMWSSDVSGTPGAGASPSRYQSLVLADGPATYWTLDETSGTTANDLAGADPASRGSLVTAGVSGAIIGETRPAFRFNGLLSSSTMNDTVAQYSMDYFSAEAWFKTTSTRGGLIMGFDSSSSGGGSAADRFIYLSNNGQLNFAVRPNGLAKSITSAGQYRDGLWHHVVGTLSGQGMALYVDGAQVGFSADTKSGLAFGTRTGYWRVGGDSALTNSNVPNRPTSNLLAGDLDEIATYPVALTAGQIRSHYTLGATGVAPNVLPRAAFTTSTSPLSVAVDGSKSTDTDGQIASYAWDYGDGATGSGVTAQHTYAAAGTYTVTLTVTDDRGGSQSTSQQVTVDVPPNSPPVAAFVPNSTDLALSVDGSSSTDSDGVVAGYAWDFGDGSTDSGAAANHTYAAAGSYLVKLAVTDDDGATNSLSKVITVPSGATAYAFDDFNRSLASGLGSADLGGSWTTSGASGFAVSGGDGIFKLSTPGATRTAYLPSAAQANTDIQTSFTTDQAPTGGGIYATVLGRRVSSTEDYRLNVRLTSTNKVTVSLTSLQGSATATALSPVVTLPGTYAAGTDVRMRMQVTGSSPTTIRAKVWLAGDSEPADWTVSATDSYATLQGSGSVGLSAYLSGSSTNAMNVAVHRLVATS